jgi:hypothetical protein
LETKPLPKIKVALTKGFRITTKVIPAILKLNRILSGLTFDSLSINTKKATINTKKATINTKKATPLF